MILNVPDYDKHKEYFKDLCNEAVMILKLVLLIGCGSNYEELFENGDQEFLEKECMNQEDRVVCDFYSHNRVLPRENQITSIHKVLGKFNIKGKISFKDPTIRYQVIE